MSKKENRRLIVLRVFAVQNLSLIIISEGIREAICTLRRSNRLEINLVFSLDLFVTNDNGAACSWFMILIHGDLVETYGSQDV